MIIVDPHPIQAASALAAFEQIAGDAGAIVSFTGNVRGHAQNRDVTGLHLQAYEPLTSSGIAGAVTQAKARWPLTGVVVRHRIGDMTPGETIVFVAAAAAHRRAAFEAADFLMDYLKTEAVFWKKETTAAGPQWIEPRPEDYTDRNRWHTQEPDPHGH